MPKRPRVFFTEEQKDKLRLAYNHDPYPNQGTIEALAAELNVGVKTVINWFHNHRMRAKQQQHIGNLQGSQGYSDGNSNHNIKSEPNDDNSMHSDISSMSDDTSQFSSSFHGNESGNQWLFPQFEPAVMQKLVKERAMENGNRGDDDDDDDGQSSEKDAEMKDAKNDEDDEDAPVFNDVNENSNDGEQNPGQNEVNLNVSPGVNRRKRSNPKYVSEGRELDKTKNVYGGSLKSCLSKDEGVEMDDDIEKENEFGNIDLNLKAQNGQHLNKINKLQKAIDSSVDDWEEEFDNVPSIDKLQKNLHTCSSSPQTAGTWEF